MKKTMAWLLALALVFGLGLTGSVAPAAADAEELETITIMGYERMIADNASFAKAVSGELPQKVWDAASDIFKAAGFDLQFEIIADQEQYTTTVQTRMAAGYNLPDIVCLSTMSEADVLGLADNGVILPMNEILETTKGPAYNYFYGGEGERARNMLSDENGNFWWLPRIQINLLEGKEAGTSMGICIRLDWLNKLNLPVPSSLDEFTDALRAFQENDMNGNGIKDEVAVVDVSAFGNGIDYWFGMVNGGREGIGVNVTAGTVESPWYSPVAKEYFEYVRMLVEEGLLYMDAIGTDNNTDQLQNENKVSALYYYPVGTYAEAPIRAAGVPDAEYIGIIPFDAVEGVHGFYSEETPYLVYLKTAVTNSAAGREETIAKFFDVLYDTEMFNLIDWGIEGVNYAVNEDGSYSRLAEDVSHHDKWVQGIAEFDHMARNFFPTIRHNERTDEINRTIDAGWPEKGKFEYDANGYPYITPNDNSGYYALATAEETEILAEYTTDLSTYSRELAANLALGRASLDDWDSYIEELQELGLDEILAVRQAQLDRRNGK